MVCPGRTTFLALIILNAASVAPSLALAAGSSPKAPAAPPVSAAAADESASPTAAARPTFHAGSTAPDFDIATTPYGWRRFSDFWKEGEIVLVFEPDEPALIAIEREVRAIAGSGVSLTVVRRRSDGDNWDALARLGLSYTLLSDPNGYIAELFGLGGGPATPVAPAWCLVDRDGVVRHAAAGVPTTTLAADIGTYVRSARAMAEGSDPR